MKKNAFLGSAAVVALSAGNGLAATPFAVAHAIPHKVISHAPGLTTLYDQTSDELSSTIGSQNFGATYSQYDDAAADDFVVPAGHKWAIKEVDVAGVDYGSGPASSLNVTFYKNSSGIPSAVKSQCLNESNAGYNGNGGYAIKLVASTCTNGVVPKMKAGHYWVSVVANQNYSSGNQWFWTLNGTIHKDDAMWENPGGGFGLDQCVTWCDLSNVIGYSDDLAFTLKGRDIVG
jgi:hypothetical protein